MPCSWPLWKVEPRAIGVVVGKPATPKRLFNGRAISGTERSVQFNLLALATTHHGKRTLGHNASCPAKGV
jgi:hypothetical protein